MTYDGRSEATDKNFWSEKSYQDFSLIVDWRPARKPEGVPLPMILPGGDAALDVAALQAVLGTKLDKPGEWHRFHITRQAGMLAIKLDGQLLLANLKVSDVRGPFALRHTDAGGSFANIFVKELK